MSSSSAFPGEPAEKVSSASVGAAGSAAVGAAPSGHPAAPVSLVDAARDLLRVLDAGTGFRDRLRALMRFERLAPDLLRALQQSQGTWSAGPVTAVDLDAVEVVSALEAALRGLPGRWRSMRAGVTAEFAALPEAVWTDCDEESVFSVSLRWPDELVRGFVTAFKVSDETYKLFEDGLLVRAAVVRAPRWMHAVLLQRMWRFDDPGVVVTGPARTCPTVEELAAALVLWTPHDPDSAFFELDAAVVAVRLLDGSAG